MNAIQLIQNMPWTVISIGSAMILAYALGYRSGKRKEENDLKYIYISLTKISWDLQMRANQMTKVDPKVTNRPAFLRRIK